MARGVDEEFLDQLVISFKRNNGRVPSLTELVDLVKEKIRTTISRDTARLALARNEYLQFDKFKETEAYMAAYDRYIELRSRIRSLSVVRAQKSQGKKTTELQTLLAQAYQYGTEGLRRGDGQKFTPLQVAGWMIGSIETDQLFSRVNRESPGHYALYACPKGHPMNRIWKNPDGKNEAAPDTFNETQTSPNIFGCCHICGSDLRRIAPTPAPPPEAGETPIELAIAAAAKQEN